MQAFLSIAGGWRGDTESRKDGSDFEWWKLTTERINEGILYECCHKLVARSHIQATQATPTHALHSADNAETEKDWLRPVSESISGPITALCTPCSTTMASSIGHTLSLSASCSHLALIWASILQFIFNCTPVHNLSNIILPLLLSNHYYLKSIRFIIEPTHRTNSWKISLTNCLDKVKILFINTYSSLPKYIINRKVRTWLCAYNVHWHSNICHQQVFLDLTYRLYNLVPNTRNSIIARKCFLFIVWHKVYKNKSTRQPLLKKQLCMHTKHINCIIT